MAFWWCLTHNAVEGSANDDSGCRSLSRLGPYSSSQEASTAVERTRARTAAEDARDEAEDSWGS